MLLRCLAIAGLSLIVLQRCGSAAPPITCAAFTADGQEVVTGSQLGLHVRSWPKLEVARALATRLANVHDLAFSHRGDLLAIAGGRPGESGELEIFAWPTGESLVHRTLGADLLYAVSWLDDERLVVGGERGEAYVVAKNGEAISTTPGHSRAILDIAALPFSGKERMIVSASKDFTLKVWGYNEATGELSPLRSLTQHAGAVNAIAVRPVSDATRKVDSPTILASAGDDRTVRFWQPASGRQMRFARLPSPALAIDWAPSGRWLLAACADGMLRVVDFNDVANLRELPAIEGWAYALTARADGKQALVAGEGGHVAAIDYGPRE